MVFYKIRNMLMALVVVVLGGICFSITAQAAEVLPTAGVATVLMRTLTEEEYIVAAKEAKNASWGYTNLGVANVPGNRLNIRLQPDTSAEMVGQLPHHAVCEVLDMADGWAHITSGEVEGYVSLEYLFVGPDAILVAKELPQPFGVALTKTEARYGEGVSDVRVDLVEYAKQFVGNPYVWGGTSLTKGADCSGFVLSIFKKYGFDLPHSSGGQSKYGTAVTVDEMKPGDLVFYANSKGNINHVAIYIGNGQVVHASTKATGIKISDYNYRTPYKIKSLL